MGCLLEQAFRAFAKPMAIVIHKVKRRTRPGLGSVSGRNKILAIVREEIGPFLEFPGIQQFGLLEQKLFGLGSCQWSAHVPFRPRLGSPETNCRRMATTMR